MSKKIVIAGLKNAIERLNLRKEKTLNIERFEELLQEIALKKKELKLLLRE